MSVFTYNNGVPDSLNDPSDDQPDMLTNTQSIEGIWDVDHYTFGTGADIDGRHKQASMQNQSAPGVPTGSDGVYYVNGNLPYFQNALISDYNIAVYQGAVSATTNGYTRLPGGVIFQWGIKTSPGSSGVVTFPIPFPSGNPPFSITATILANSGNVIVTVKTSPAVSDADFNYDISSGTSGFYWLAVGN